MAVNGLARGGATRSTSRRPGRWGSPLCARRGAPRPPPPRMGAWARLLSRPGPHVLAALGRPDSLAALGRRPSSSPPRGPIRALAGGRPAGPRAGNRSRPALPARPCCGMGPPRRPTALRGRPGSQGRRAPRARGLQACGAALTGPPGASGRRVRCAPLRKPPRGHSRCGRKPTRRRSRPRDSAKRGPRAKPRRPGGRAWSGASRQASGAWLGASVAPWAGRARPSSRS
jgi:hypothetical protein